MSQIPCLQTERLRLRAPQASDAPVYHRFYTDGEASAFYGGPKSALEAWNKLASDLGHWHLRGHGLWVLERQEDGAAIGACGLVWPDGWPRSELTWWILPEARRQGFAKEASRAAVSFGYEALKWDLVQTHMLDENHAAKALVLSLGGEVIAREEFPDGFTRNIYRLPPPRPQTSRPQT